LSANLGSVLRFCETFSSSSTVILFEHVC